MIPFNKPYLTGKETYYIEDAVKTGKISGNGKYTKMCQDFFEQQYGFKKCLLTTSCTDALEMCAMLADIQPGDEVIIPSYTFVSTAIAFIRQGAKVVFADSYYDNPNIDVGKIESLITPKTKAIVPVHYAGVACDMDAIMSLANKYNLLVIEDAAQAIDSFHVNKDGKKRALGRIGHLSAFYFHENKNIIAGEGGMVVVNDERFVHRAEVIWEKGTNRSAFFRGEVDKYNWVDVGSSFLPSEITAAYLWAQLEQLDFIQRKRKAHWEFYFNQLKPLVMETKVELPLMPAYATNNGHIFYLLAKNQQQQLHLLNHLKQSGVQAIFHYLPLHKSPFMMGQSAPTSLPHAERFADTLIRLPLFVELTPEQLTHIVNSIKLFYREG
jgi:dTDP-4-amino-4,6-dideoxygalactose transaminase